MALKKCPECGNEISENETVCKHCGYFIYQNDNKKKYKIGSMILLIGIVIIVFIVIGFYKLSHLDRTESYKVGNKQELNSKKGIAKTFEPTPEPDPIEFDNIDLEDYNAINELMDKYFIAKRNCDREALNELTSSSVTDEYMEELEASARIVEDYKIVKNYFIKGYDENSLIVYTEYEIKFYNIATLASSLSYKFLIKNDSGDWYISEITDSIKQYISLIEEREEVRNLVFNVDIEFQKELSEDDKLKKLYDEINIIKYKDSR